MTASIRPASPSSMPSCRRSVTPGCSAPSRGSTGATANRIICAISPGSGPISPARWRTRHWRGSGNGMPPTCRRRSRNLPVVSQVSLNLSASPARNAGPGCFESGSESMVAERRKGERVTFERGFAAHMMGIDGTWRRDCTMEDISETGAKLTIEGSVEGLHLKEFFLLLSSTGLAYRRCELTWVNGDQIGVNFLKTGDKKKKSTKRGAPLIAEV